MARDRTADDGEGVLVAPGAHVLLLPVLRRRERTSHRVNDGHDRTGRLQLGERFVFPEPSWHEEMRQAGSLLTLRDGGGRRAVGAVEIDRHSASPLAVASAGAAAAVAPPSPEVARRYSTTFALSVIPTTVRRW